MGKTRLIGDIHGNWYDYQLITASIDFPSIQVGDFGIGFSNDYWHERVNDFHASGQHRFIRGNHDNPSVCRQDMVGYISDGVVENDVMFLGGAHSIDHIYRTEGVDWWKDEELSYKELYAAIELYATVKPRVMITHDCPTLAAYYMFVQSGKTIAGKSLHLTRTGEALQAMFEVHQPEFWFFGHWHYTTSQKINGTTFQCIGISDFVDVEL